MANQIQNRYEFVYLFDVENGNPNGDPDAGNMPRIDPETNFGIVTDVCLKRKVRNYVDVKFNDKSPHRIYIREKSILNNTHKEAYEANNIALSESDDKKRKGSGDEVERVRKWMCDNFYDIRTFGAVMSTGINCGQVRGPIQINFGKSVESIMPLEITITRMAVATEEEAKKQQGDNRTMGRKHIIPYALYRTEGYVSAFLANQTGFNEDDLNLFWEALLNMFEHDHSAARGNMNARKLIVFKHQTALGNAPSYKLFNAVKIERVKKDDLPSRKFEDYEIKIVRDNVPQSVEIIEML
ncbi:MAG: type I-C CRISPR-associated protein Cas7/Csd2 [Thermotogae bacterium]|jgi:CRISPR-associated protein Csd2|nr:type I-C CRISPR-associated protein Cas7/Csd2 [Thermotogota bacterium]MCL5032191.1 type I-C CRISPR-associated protein Cas7/Csd2 [Thermotogota bacterium]